MTAPAEDPRGGEDEVSECTAYCKPVPDGSLKGHWHDLDNGQKWVWAMFPPRPPAAGRGDTDSSGELVCDRRHLHGADCYLPPEGDAARPAGDRAQPTEGLHAELVAFLYDYGAGQPWEAADALLALPELAALLDAQAKVERVEALLPEMFAAWEIGPRSRDRIRRALDGAW